MKTEKYSQIARKLLSTDAGKKALSELLGGAQIVTRDPNAVSGPIVATLTPCYKYPEPEMTEGWNNMVKYSAEHGVTVYNGTQIRNSSVVHWTRNQLLANLIKTQRPWTHVLFIDDDIAIQPETCVRLLSHGKDIVGAACTRRQDPPMPNIRYWEEESGNFREILDWGTDGLIEVGAVGTGVMLISREALQNVLDSIFNCKYEVERYGVTPEWVEQERKTRLEDFDKTADGWWFDFYRHIKGGCKQYGEDISFCLVAKRYAGISVYADTSLRPRHLGLYGYSLDDFIPYREQMIARAKAEGKYHAPAEEVTVTE